MLRFTQSLRQVLRAAGSDAAAAGSAPKKLNLFFSAPHEVFHSNEAVDSVYLPSRDGVMGVLPGYQKTIAQLKPGVLSVQNGSSVQEFFVSGGFATIDGANAHVTVAEAVPLDQLDAAACNAALNEFKAKLSSTNEEEKFIAQTGVEVYEAMSFALSQKK